SLIHHVPTGRGLRVLLQRELGDVAPDLEQVIGLGVTSDVALDLNECDPRGVVGSPDLKVFEVGPPCIRPTDAESLSGFTAERR
ncbi:MAG: hypothetical protein ABSG36_16685, partial [Acidimicrobiales bacterium]